MLKLELLIDELDYESVFDACGSMIMEKLRAGGNPLGMLPPAMVKSFIGGIPRQKLDEMAADLINANRAMLQRGVEELAASKGVKLTVVGTKAEAER